MCWMSLINQDASLETYFDFTFAIVALFMCQVDPHGLLWACLEHASYEFWIKPFEAARLAEHVQKTFQMGRETSAILDICLLAKIWEYSTKKELPIEIDYPEWLLRLPASQNWEAYLNLFPFSDHVKRVNVLALRNEALLYGLMEFLYKVFGPIESASRLDPRRYQEIASLSGLSYSEEFMVCDPQLLIF